jgi:beta-galactosidase
MLNAERSILSARRIVVGASVLSLALAAAGAAPPQTLRVSGDQFVLGGKPFQIISGEMHYARIPREYWRDRLAKARAMGLNTISTYVFWNLHEPRPGVFDFTGQLDVAAYIRTAQEVGLHVVLRPGPYVCSEWDLGGLPAWLLADPAIVVRGTDARFMSAARRYLDRLGEELAPLQAGRGGPIIAVQVENEYGSFDNDHEYMREIRDAIMHAGFTDALLYTADGPGQLEAGTLPDLPAVVNFGPGEAAKAFDALTRFRPGAPRMAGEYWAGWFDQWGHGHQTTDRALEARELAQMLAAGDSVNLYMYHGGTTFGFMNGANVGGEDSPYEPQTTSYDYDAALDESGRPTPKYFAFRDVIAKHLGTPLPSVPESPAPIAVPSFNLQERADPFEHLPAPVTADTPKSMEALGQSYGYVLYRTHVSGPVHGVLALADLRDYAVVLIDGTPAGTLDRRLKQDRLTIDVREAGARLDVLVENTGRINFRKALRSERKGIAGASVDGRALTGWQMYPLPLSDVSSLRFTRSAGRGPAFYRGSFTVAQPADTFLDLRGWTKGTAWVNGHHLGRYWRIGPQQTLYVPGPWLKPGRNDVVLFELGTPGRRSAAGLSSPVLDAARPARR